MIFVEEIPLSESVHTYQAGPGPDEILTLRASQTYSAVRDRMLLCDCSRQEESVAVFTRPYIWYPIWYQTWYQIGYMIGYQIWYPIYSSK